MQLEDKGTFVSAETVHGVLRSVYGDELKDCNTAFVVPALKTVSFVLISSTKSTLSKVPITSVSDSIAFTISVAEPVAKNVPITNVPEGTTGLAALQMAAAQEDFEISVGNDGWIVHIDNVSKNWNKTGGG